MDQLIGPNVQVVLSLKEGKGFDKITNPTCIIATLNGLSLETDLINPDPNPQYITDLVWEANKSALRKMRSGQEPLKIEYFELKENGTKDKIGYLLLSLRTAQIIGRGNNHNLRVNWHKLLGLRSDVKADKPELFISLTIKERDQIASVASSRRDLTVMNEAVECDIPIPYLIPDEYLIQLGPINTCRDIFLLYIIVGKIANLDELMKKSVHKTDIHKFYSLWYYILENEIQSKSFTYNFQPRTLDEKIIIRIRSCLNVLKYYFENKSHCFVILKYGDDIIGESTIDVKFLISTNNIDDYMENSNDGTVVLNEHCFLNTLNSNDDTFNATNKPYFDVQIKLQYIGMKTFNNGLQTETIAEIHRKLSTCNHLSSIESIDSRHMMRRISDIDFHRYPGGDCQRCTVGAHATRDELTQRIDRVPLVELSDKRPEHTHTYMNCDYSKTVEAYHGYCLHIILDSIKLKSETSVKNIEFRFHHPKAEIMSTLHPKMQISSGKQLRLHDIGCKLHFISAAEEIRHLLLSFPPKVTICDADHTDEEYLGQLTLDVGRVFDEMKFECKYDAALIDNGHNEIGCVHVIMHLEDHGPYYRADKRLDENFGPPILDDTLAYKIVDELETWKERQQEMFRLDLKRKEERLLNRLSEEWQIRRESLESKLNCSVEQCKLLANNLNKATDDLRVRRLQSLDKEARLIKANEDIKWSYDRKLQEQEEAFKKIQQDLQSKMLVLEQQNRNFESQIESMKTENVRLQTIIKKQSKELETYNKGTLTQNQIENLMHEVKTLESKLNSTQKSKSFFKEQWGKAVREIHKMKMEHRQAIELQIKSSKQKLKDIDLEQLLHIDSAALSNDQILLGQIQKEIDVIKPKTSAALNDPQETIFTPTNNSGCRSYGNYTNAGNSPVVDEKDERLRKLIEERDSLLKTSSYTIDDAIIVKLNTEIRSILINN